jgi:hypothetical protein
MAVILLHTSRQPLRLDGYGKPDRLTAQNMKMNPIDAIKGSRFLVKQLSDRQKANKSRTDGRRTQRVFPFNNGVGDRVRSTIRKNSCISKARVQ